MEKKDKTNSVEPDKDPGEPHRIRLPGFIEEEIGLGDVIQRATSAFGIRACAGCKRRAAALNRWFTFSGKNSK